MKLKQLECLVEVARSGFNVSAAAERLHASQPAVSKQLRALEDELGTELFQRNGKSFAGLTPIGADVLERAQAILREADNIKIQVHDFLAAGSGELTIGTTQTQARYVLPETIASFRERHPAVVVHMHQGTSEQLAEQVLRDEVDLVIATEGEPLFESLVRIPVYRWRFRVLAPADHPLVHGDSVSLPLLAEHPLVTYSFSSREDSTLSQAFLEAGVRPKIAFTARDADVIKTYVKQGVGLGVLASMAVDVEESDLVALKTCQLFPELITWVGFRRGRYLRDYMRDFIEILAPQIDRNLLSRLERRGSPSLIERLFSDPELPSRV